MEIGIHRDIPLDEYLRDEAFSKSSVSAILRSPMHFMHHRRYPTPATDAMKMGSLIENLIQRPDSIASQYAVQPETYTQKVLKKTGEKVVKPWNNNATACRQWKQEQREAGRKVITAKQLTTAQNCADSVIAGCTFSGETQLTICWQDVETGVICRGRPDWWDIDRGIIWDLKKTVDASASAFAKSVRSYGYHLQKAMYLDGAAALGKPANDFIFVAVEEDPPHGVAQYSLSEEWIELGRRTYREALRIYSQCRDVDHWPGYSRHVVVLEPSRWELKEEDEL